MSRKPARIKVVDLEKGMPTVEQARLRMQYELQLARKDGYEAVKLIHGYGSSGAIQAFIAGENWRISDSGTWKLLKEFPEWRKDADLGGKNKGISVVIF